MTPEFILHLAQQSIYVILIVSAPVVGVALVIGLIISIFQATTQIQEQTLSFVPKIVAVFLTMLIFGPWMLQKLIDFTQNVLGNLNHYVG